MSQSNPILVVAAIASFALCGFTLSGPNTALAQAAEATKPLDQSFPEKVGTSARSAVKKNTPIGGANDAAEAKYTAPSGDITWTATAFATPEEAMAILTSTLDKMKADGGKVGMGIKNAEGKVRFAAVETKEGLAYCWVNKKQKNIFYVVTGKAPDVSKFIEAQTTW